MDFEKWQGTGNHHVVVERDRLRAPLDAVQARRICDPHFGVGADGVLEISWDGPHPRMTVWNRDGSLSENCGNGIRIVARYLHEKGKLPADGIVLTGDERTCVRILDDNHVEVAMGTARFPASAQSETLTIDGTPLPFVDVSMGNPHAVIEVPAGGDPARLMERFGPQVEGDARFPERTNAEFVRRDGPSELTVYVWERGAGATLACGTGACAAAAVAVRLRGAASPVTVHLPGGDLTIGVDDADQVVMTGPAERVFTGTLESAPTE